MLVTVALPLYRMKLISWLCLESLCRFATRHDWELIVAEEEDEHDATGRKEIESYSDRLKAAGCVSIEYLRIPLWIPLGSKWNRLVKASHNESELFLLTAGDTYYMPERIDETVETANANPNCVWFQTTHFGSYSIEKCVACLREWLPGQNRNGECLATRTPLAKTVSLKPVAVNVDGVFQDAVGADGAMAWWKSANPYGGFQTRGLNTISTDTSWLLKYPRYDLRSHIDEHIVDRLRDLATKARPPILRRRGGMKGNLGVRVGVRPRRRR